MFVRFVVSYQHENSHRLTGVFQAAHRLVELGLLEDHEESAYQATRRWFNRHLPVPGRFSRSRRPHAHRNAICWFKPNAIVFIDRVKELVAILERHDLPIRSLQTERPGYVVYEDDYQVAAVPFRDTNA